MNDLPTLGLIAQLSHGAAILLALAILWRTEPALARMGRATHWMIRYALLLIAGGALGVLLTTLDGATLGLPGLLLLAGIALLLLCDRRLRFLLRRYPGDHHA